MDTARVSRVSRQVAFTTSPLSKYRINSSSGSQTATYPEIRAARSRLASVRRLRRWTYARRVRGRSTRLYGNRKLARLRGEGGAVDGGADMQEGKAHQRDCLSPGAGTGSYNVEQGLTRAAAASICARGTAPMI